MVVRNEPDLTAFDLVDFTTIDTRFKVLGTSEGICTINPVTSYNPIFQFRIPADSTDNKGVIVSTRDELVKVNLGT